MTPLAIDPGDAATVLTALAGSGSVGGAVAWLLTLRQRRRQMDASAGAVEASATERIMAAAAGLVEHAGASQVGMAERIAILEGEEQGNERRELNSARRVINEWQGWVTAIVSWAETAVAAITELGGHIEAPPSPPRSPAGS